MLKNFSFILLYILINQLSLQAMVPEFLDLHVPSQELKTKTYFGSLPKELLSEINLYRVWNKAQDSINTSKTLDEALQQIQKLPLFRANLTLSKAIINALHKKFPYEATANKLTNHFKDDIAKKLYAMKWLEEQERKKSDNDLLLKAISNGDLQAVKEFISQGSDITGDFFSAPLSIAINARQLAIVIYLLDQGADVNQQVMGFSPLIDAVYNFPEAVPLLLERGADIHMKGPSKLTALEVAQHAGKTSIAQLLIDAAAKVPSKN